MPAKRRVSARKAPAKKPEPVEEPVVEEPVQETEEVDLNETENIEEAIDEVNADEEEDDDNDKKASKKELTIEEKIEQLDQLSKAHPFGLLMSMCKLQNKLRPAFAVKNATKDEAEGDAIKSPKELSCVARYGDIKITIPKIDSSNLKFAKKVGADLLLSEMYGDDHEMEEDSQKIKNEGGIEVTKDEEWYSERKEKLENMMGSKVDRMAAKINENKNYDDDEKARRLERIEKFRKTKGSSLLLYSSLLIKYQSCFLKQFNISPSY